MAQVNDSPLRFSLACRSVVEFQANKTGLVLILCSSIQLVKPAKLDSERISTSRKGSARGKKNRGAHKRQLQNWISFKLV